MSAVALLSIGFYFVSPDQLWLIFAFQISIGLCLGPKSPLVFSMYADTARLITLNGAMADEQQQGFFQRLRSHKS